MTFSPSGALWSASRRKGKTQLVEHRKTSATSVYTTPDKVAAIWVSPSGAIHAAGRKYHSNVSGTWKASPIQAEVMTLWGTADDDLWAGGSDGEVLRYDGRTWTTIHRGDMVTGIAGRSANDVHVATFSGYLRWNGKALKLATKGAFQGVTIAGKHVFLCGTDIVFRDGKKIGAIDGSDELYGVGVGAASVFALGPAEVFEVRSGKLTPVALDPAWLSVKRGEYSTAIASDGKRVAIGGTATVIVHDGRTWKAWAGV